MNQYELFIRNENRQIIAQVEDFTDFACIRRFNLPGTWNIAGPADLILSLTKNKGIVVRRNGQDYFSGNVSEFEDLNGQGMTVNGYSDEGMLSGQLAYPVPAGAPYNAEYDTRTGVAETIIKQYVNLNVGPSAIAARKISGLSIEVDKSRGSTITGNARFDDLSIFINSLATQGGLGFRILDMVFQVYTPVDKSGWIVFSKELGTLGSYTYKEKRGKVNYAIVGGSGSGTARVIVEVANSQSILDWGRKEKFIDKNNISSITELTAAGIEELEKSGDEVSLSFQPKVTAAMRPVDDYDIGDWVAGVIRSTTIIQQVREIKTSFNGSGGEQTEVAIGTEGATTDLSTLSRVYERMRRLDDRLFSLERS